jgi:hypothetical protein
MYKQDSVHQVLSDYKIKIIKQRMERRQIGQPYSYSVMNIPNAYDQFDRLTFQEEIIPMITAEMPEKEFTAMADALCEMRDLMRDPETAKLLMEARFINRLKGGY